MTVHKQPIYTVGDLQAYCEGRDKDERVLVQIIDNNDQAYNVHAELINLEHTVASNWTMTQLRISHHKLERIVESGEGENQHNQTIDRIIEQLRDLKK